MKRSPGQIRLRRTASNHPREMGRLAGGEEKLFYKIGEVSDITGLKPYVLRYWETEFPFLRPRKSRGGQRVYLRKDIETILKIKQMLYEEGYTIAGARKVLGQRTREQAPSQANLWSKTFLLRLRADLADVLRIVSSYEQR